MAEELKPCPLCGGKSEIYQEDDPDKLYYARCSSCFSETKSYKTQEEVIVEWNDRQRLLLEAKPCPFCGGKAKFYQIGKDDGIVWKVMCGARVDCSSLVNEFDTLEEAIAAWNNRAGGNSADFITLVCSMREQQKAYFSSRSDDALRESKRYEQLVDKAISDFFSRQIPIFSQRSRA